jgi:phosphoribosylamine--glycine ligase
MIAAQDHKRIGEGDTGPNTGGMGAYCPVSIAPPSLIEETVQRVFLPTLRALREAGRPFTGLLYAGLMLTPQGIKVVEFNCRFGDPETQAILPLMQSSLMEPIVAVARGESLGGHPPHRWLPGASVTTVLAAHGYPGTVRSGDEIAISARGDDVIVFHAGTTSDAEGALRTAGGRVLAVTATAPTLAAACDKSASAAENITFEGKQFRRDIGWRELQRGA